MSHSLCRQYLLSEPIKLSAELRLAQAISELQLELNTQEKEHMRAQSRYTPEEDDIMTLTVEINQRLHHNGFRRCYGPRMTSFLRGLQEFASLGDIIAGGSQSLLASGVWACVRFALLAAAGQSTIMEKLSKLFMEASQSLPQLQGLRDIFPRSSVLQDDFFEYYLVVVRLCQRTLRMSKKSSICQFWCSYDSYLVSYADELNKWSDRIKINVQIEALKIDKIERKRHHKFRNFARQQIDVQTRRQQQEDRQAILDTCTTYQHRTVWKQYRKLGTTTLFTDDDVYHRWKTSKTSQSLVYTGKLGSGKSVMMANIIDDLYLAQDRYVAYFFCRYDVEESLQARTIIGSIARQILQRVPDLSAITDKFQMLSGQASVEEIVDVIKEVICDSIYVVIDGLDDCNVTERTSTLEALQDLKSHLNICLVISSRTGSKELKHTICYQEKDHLFTSIPSSHPDIQAYVDQEVSDRVQAGDLSVSDIELITRIKETLVAESHGMFLWVVLQIESLCSMQSDQEIRMALTSLPAGISDTYARLLDKHKGCRYQQRLFEVLVGSLCPLTSEELREALSVDIGNISYDPSRLINNVDNVVRNCAGLVVTDEEEKTVRLIHHSFRQYLVVESQVPISEEGSAGTMSDIVLTYLNYSMFDTQLTRPSLKRKLCADQIPVAIIAKHMPKTSRYLLRPHSEKMNKAIENTILRSCKDNTSFQGYARQYCISHLVKVEQHEDRLSLLRGAIIQGGFRLQDKYNQTTALQQATQYGCEPLVRLFLDYPLQHMDKLKAIRIAASLKSCAMLDLLIKYCHKLELLLFDAIIDDSLLLLQTILINDEINVNFMIKGLTPLLFAIKTSRILLVETLLKDPRVDKKCTDKSWRGPLRLAVATGNPEIVRLLLDDPGVQIKGADKGYEQFWSDVICSPDKAASLDLTRLLVESGYFSLNGPQGRGTSLEKTPLMLAVEQRRESAVKSLLENGDNLAVNVEYIEYRALLLGDTANRLRSTALDFAKDKPIIRMLEKAGARSANTRTKRGGFVVDSHHETVPRKGWRSY